jgi:phage terminase small subunit
MEGQRDEYGLTRKQRKFAENVVSGMTLADAYRNSYDAENMKPASIHRRACELMTDGKVKACAEALAVEKKRLVEVATVSDRDMLVRLLRSWSTGEESATNSQLRAAELLGKACGLYRDVLEDHRERPAQVVAAELEAKLAALVERVNSPPSAERPPQVEPVPPKPVPSEVDGAVTH